MSKDQPTLSKKEAAQKDETSVFIRTVIISSIILAGLFVLLFFLEDNLGKIFGNWADEAVIGGMLLVLWLVVSSTVRSLHKLKSHAETWKILICGLLVGALGSGLFNLFLIVFPRVSKSENIAEVANASGIMIAVISAIALFASLLTIVNLRIRSKLLGNILELLIIAAVIGGILYFAGK